MSHQNASLFRKKSLDRWTVFGNTASVLSCQVQVSDLKTRKAVTAVKDMDHVRSSSVGLRLIVDWKKKEKRTSWRHEEEWVRQGSSVLTVQLQLPVENEFISVVPLCLSFGRTAVISAGRGPRGCSVGLRASLLHWSVVTRERFFLHAYLSSTRIESRVQARGQVLRHNTERCELWHAVVI